MSKKMVLITAWLIGEADEVPNENLEKEIVSEIQEAGTIPWVLSIEQVKVLEAEKKCEQP